VRGFIEKYYKATARAYHINLVIIPEVHHAKTLLAFTSHDLALELLAEIMRARDAPVQFIPVAVGSLDSLIALRQGVCHMAGCHLLDLESGTYNLPYVQRIFPGEPMQIIHLARRLQGLIIQPGNPLQIRGIEDLARPDVRLANRKRGTGTRLWLDHKLQSLGLAPSAINGYDQVADTHLQVATMVAEGRADAGLGLFAAALQNEMGFIPVFEEAFDLVVPAEFASLDIFQPVWDLLTSAEFRIGVQALGGYYPRHMGDVMII
jgi:putative molybdopterin biosynthesis protein